MPLDLAILVSSYDGYADLWEPYFTLFHRNWPDCPYPIYLLANYKSFPDPSVRMVFAGDVRAWPESMAIALGQIREEYILLMLEDLFIAEKVNTTRFLKLAEWIYVRKPACVRLWPATGMTRTEVEGICQIPSGAPYRSSTVLSLWRKDVLLDLLKPGESIWQFEVMGSVRTDKYPDFFATDQPCIRHWNGVIRGKWVPDVQRKLLAAGIPVDLKARELFSFSDRLTQSIREIRAAVLKLMPARFQRRIRLLFATTPSSSCNS